MAWHLAGGIQSGLLDAGADGEGRAGIFTEDAGLDISHTDRATGLVQGTRAHQSLRAQSQFSGNLVAQLSDHLARLPVLGQLAGCNSKLRQHLRPPSPRAEIPIAGGRDQRTFTDKFACQPVQKIIFNKQEFCGPFKDFGLMFFDPKDLGSRPGGHQLNLARDFIGGLMSKYFPQFIRFLLGAVVQPYNGAAQGPAIGIRQDQCFTLCRDPHRLDLRWGNPGILEDFAQGGFESLPICLHLHFDRIGIGRDQVVLHRGLGDHIAVQVMQGTLECRSAQVKGQDSQHRPIVPVHRPRPALPCLRQY